VLNDERGSVCLRVGRRLPEQDASQRERQSGNGPD
jgi:hypothetical protein